MIKSIGGSGTEIRGSGTDLEIGDPELFGKWDWVCSSYTVETRGRL